MQKKQLSEQEKAYNQRVYDAAMMFIRDTAGDYRDLNRRAEKCRVLGLDFGDVTQEILRILGDR